MPETSAQPLAVPDVPVWRCKCGAEPHATDSRRCRRGHPRQRTQLALMHALRAADLPSEFAHLQEELTVFIEASLTDDGGSDHVPTRRRSLHEYRARLHRRILQLDAALELRGLFDKRGKLRIAWLQQLQSLVNAAKGVDQLLGLARQPKPVPSLHDVLNGHGSGDRR